MDQGLIPKRYAKALFEVAKDNGYEKDMYLKMQALSAAFAAEPKLAATMQNPFVAPADKAALIYAACGSDSTDAPVADFIKLLETNHRLGLVRDIAIAYQDIYRRDKDIHRVEVTAAAPMSPEGEDRLKKLILRHLNGGTMEYSFRVDPDLIGGFAVNIDNQRLDASVKNELKQLRLKLLSNK